EKVAPEAIEQTVAAFDGAIAAGAALVTSKSGFDEIWVAFETEKSVDIERLREHCREKLPSVFVPKRFLAIARLPRNAMGKLDRLQLQRMLETEATASAAAGSSPA